MRTDAEVLANGHKNQGLWYRAWPAVKKSVSAAKANIVHTANAQRQDIIISDTGSDAQRTVLTSRSAHGGFALYLYLCTTSPYVFTNPILAVLSRLGASGWS